MQLFDKNSGVNRWHFLHFCFFNDMMIFSLYLIEIFPMTHDFGKKNIVKHVK